MNKNRIVDFCDKIIEFFLYTLIFCLPFSKAIIEVSASIIILAWITKRIFSYNPSLKRINLKEIVNVFNPVSTYLDLPIIMFIIATFLSVIFSTNFTLSLKNFGTKVMEYIMLYFIVAEVLSNKRRLRNTVIVMLVSAVMIGVDCLFQYFFGFDFLRFWHWEAGRITGSFQMPGDLAGYIGPVLCLYLSLIFLKNRKTFKIFLCTELILLLSLLIATFSRGAWIGFVIAVCFLSFWGNKKIIYVIISLLLILCVVIPQLRGTSIRISGHFKSIFEFSDPSSLDRKELWKVAIQMVKDKPLFGLGFTTFMGNFVKYDKDYRLLSSGVIPYAHNCYLQIAAETGIVGLVSFLTLIGTFFIHTIITLIRIKDKFYHAALSGISAGIIVTLVHSAVDTNLYSLQLSVLFWVMLGLNAAIQQKCFLDENSK